MFHVKPKFGIKIDVPRETKDWNRSDVPRETKDWIYIIDVPRETLE